MIAGTLIGGQVEDHESVETDTGLGGRELGTSQEVCRHAESGVCASARELDQASQAARSATAIAEL